jgi:hypothetical protein
LIWDPLKCIHLTLPMWGNTEIISSCELQLLADDEFTIMASHLMNRHSSRTVKSSEGESKIRSTHKVHWANFGFTDSVVASAFPQNAQHADVKKTSSFTLQGLPFWKWFPRATFTDREATATWWKSHKVVGSERCRERTQAR